MGGIRQRTLRAATTGWVRITLFRSVALLLVLSLVGNTYAVGTTQLPDPKIALTKSASDVTYNGDGTFNVEFTLRLQNVCNVAIQQIQIKDWLSNNIQPATIVSVSALVIDGALNELNPTFDGVDEVHLLSGNEELASGEEARIGFELTFDPGTNPGPFYNKALARGEVDGKWVEQCSKNGNNYSSSTFTTRENKSTCEKTPFELPRRSEVGLAKAATVGVLIDQAAERFETTLTFTIENFGNTDLSYIQITDDLTETFIGNATFTVVPGSIQSVDGLMVNENFNGRSNTNLLGGSDSLAPGLRASLSVRVQFEPNGEKSPFLNQARAYAKEGADDISTNGHKPDPDMDGEPRENEPTPIPFKPLKPGVIGLAKAALAESVRIGVGLFETRLTYTIENFGDKPLTGIQITDDLTETFIGTATISSSLGQFQKP